jgi:hypothetical protein
LLFVDLKSLVSYFSLGLLAGGTEVAADLLGSRIDRIFDFTAFIV